MVVDDDEGGCEVREVGGDGGDVGQGGCLCGGGVSVEYRSVWTVE